LKYLSFILIISLYGYETIAQQGSFAPQYDMEGTTAMHSDSTAFRTWATGCVVERGLRQINLPDSGYATTGNANYAVGKPDAPLVVSLGDGGSATLTFNGEIFDGPGFDFAVFENGFGSGEFAFLELAFVEVSSDGLNFLRFPSVSEQQTENQLAAFSESDASLFDNLAGKYVAMYGTPFDLADLPDTALLDKSAISHVRIIDVVGSINPEYGSMDRDSNQINDSWPTNFAQSGFDLDAVGVINSTIPLSIAERSTNSSKNENVCYSITGQIIDCEQYGLKVTSSNNGSSIIYNRLAR